MGDGLLDGVLHLVPLLLLRVRYPLTQLHSSSLQDQGVLLAGKLEITLSLPNDNSAFRSVTVSAEWVEL